MKGPAEAVKLIEQYVPFDMAPRPLLDLLEEIILDQGWVTSLLPREQAEKWLNAFSTRLKKRAAEESQRAQVSCFEFNPVNESYLQGSCFIAPSDTHEEASAKSKRSNSLHYKNAFKSISDTDFEILCSRILRLWNVEEDFFTRASADQGIDFFGQMPFGEIVSPSAISPGAEKQMKVWLVGQAKHYNASQVSTKDIRELVGSVNLARSKVYAGSRDPLSQLHMRTCDPVFFLFFTTGKISKDAFDLLMKAGVVAMDGDQLAVFLADNGIGLAGGAFDQTEFETWALG